MINNEVRDSILKMKKDGTGIEQLFQFLSRKVPEYYCLLESNDSLIEVKLNDKNYCILVTDENLLEESKKYFNVDNYKKVDGLELFQSIIRKGVDGVIINFNDESQVILNPTLLKLLYKEYVLIDLYMKGGSYVIEEKRGMLLVELQKNKYLAISNNEKDIKLVKDKLSNNGKVVFKDWKEILTYVVASKGTGLIYNLNDKDVLGIEDPYLAWLYESASLF